MAFNTAKYFTNSFVDFIVNRERGFFLGGKLKMLLLEQNLKALIQICFLLP